MSCSQVNPGTGDSFEPVPNHPKPQTLRTRIRAFLAWRKQVDRAAAIDSARNVFAVLGIGTVLADFATMRPWFYVPGALLLAGVWYADYLRHF
jgi:hypothetical protein